MKTQEMQQLLGFDRIIVSKGNDRHGSNMAYLIMSDEELIANFNEDHECFKYLFERYESRIKAYVKRITGASHEVVEDITQEVFVKIYLNIDKFNNSYKFSSWIYRIAHNQAVNVFLYEKRHKTESFQYDEVGELKTVLIDRNDIWKEIQQSNINEKLNNALSLISKKYQEVIKLNYFNEKNYKEISEKLGRPVNTVGTMLNRGKKLLKEELIRQGIMCDVALIQMEKNSNSNR